jgi:lipopolysaccharide export system protein LptA
VKVLKNILKPIFRCCGLGLPVVLLVVMVHFGSYAQQTERVELVKAGSLEGVETQAERKVKLIGDVVFKQGTMFLYCDSALQYPATNIVETYGHVRMVQGDTLSLTCKTLTYDGNTKQAVAIGNVVLKDKTMYLETDRLNYDRNTAAAYYTNGGLIKDKENVLTSKQGVYHTDSKTVQFKEEVKLVNEVKQYKIDADTLEYNTGSKIATFHGPALMTSKDGIVEGHETGSYNTVSGIMYIKGRSKINNGNQIVEADKIDYDEVKQVGVADGNAKLSSPKDSVQIEGDKLIYNRMSGVSKVLGNPVFKGYQGKDTLFITSDTMVHIRKEDKKRQKVLEEYLKLYHHVKIFRAGMQGRCDSLIYNGNDSLVTMFGNPVLWNGKSQLTADTIKMYIKNGQMHKMYMNVNAFIIMQDTIGNFNQIKGRRMEASFKENKLKSVFVDGNSESIFFVLEGDSILSGMNKSICSRIVMSMEKDTIRRVSFLTKPEAQFIPPHELLEPDRRLKGFLWRKEEKPEREDIPR